MTPGRRRFLSALAGWVFGLASTVLLVGLWGRAVATDTEELAESLTPLAASEAVAERISTWLEDEMVDAGIEPTAADDAADEVLASPELAPVLEDLVARGVEAAASNDPAGSSVDVAAILRPRSDEIASRLTVMGVPTSPPQVEAALSRLDPLVIREPNDAPFVGVSSPLATTLGTASLVGIAAMLGSGAVYVTVARDRIKALRSLLIRFGLGSLSFAVLLRIGSWLVDPAGGRAPVGETLSRLAGSKLMIPMALGLVTLVAGMIAWLFRRRTHPTAVGSGV